MKVFKHLIDLISGLKYNVVRIVIRKILENPYLGFLKNTLISNKHH